jgi:hypothetical protein
MEHELRACFANARLVHSADDAHSSPPSLHSNEALSSAGTSQQHVNDGNSGKGSGRKPHHTKHDKRQHQQHKHQQQQHAATLPLFRLPPPPPSPSLVAAAAISRFAALFVASQSHASSPFVAVRPLASDALSPMSAEWDISSMHSSSFSSSSSSSSSASSSSTLAPSFAIMALPAAFAAQWFGTGVDHIGGSGTTANDDGDGMSDDPVTAALQALSLAPLRPPKISAAAALEKSSLSSSSSSSSLSWETALETLLPASSLLSVPLSAPSAGQHQSQWLSSIDALYSSHCRAVSRAASLSTASSLSSSSAPVSSPPSPLATLPSISAAANPSFAAVAHFITAQRNLALARARNTYIAMRHAATAEAAAAAAASAHSLTATASAMMAAPAVSIMAKPSIAPTADGDRAILYDEETHRAWVNQVLENEINACFWCRGYCSSAEIPTLYFIVLVQSKTNRAYSPYSFLFSLLHTI